MEGEVKEYNLRYPGEQLPAWVNNPDLNGSPMLRPRRQQLPMSHVFQNVAEQELLEGKPGTPSNSQKVLMAEPLNFPSFLRRPTAC